MILFHSSWSLTLASGLSYLFGFLRDRLFAQTFGLSRTLDIYNAAFVLPDLILNIFISTALSAAFLPIFTKQYDQKKSLGHQYLNQMMSWGILMVVIIGLMVALTLPYFTHLLVPGFEGEEIRQYILLTRLMLISPVLFTISNLYGRFLLSLKEFLWYGISPALYNLGIILGLVYLVPAWGVAGLVIGNLIGIGLHLSIRWLAIRQRKYRFKHRLDFSISPEVKETIRLTLPKILQYSMWSYMLLSFTRIASLLSEGSIAAYNYARNFQSLPVSLLGIAISLAMYTSLSHDAARGNFKKFLKDFRRDRLRCAVYTSLAALLLAALAKPLISLLLGGGAFDEKAIHLLARTLQIYCIAVPLESLLHIYHRAYYSVKNTLIPSLSHSFHIVLSIQIAYFLSRSVGVMAIPIGFSAGMTSHLILMALIFPWLMRKKMSIAS